MLEVHTGAGSIEDTTYTDARWMEKENSGLDYTVQRKVCLDCGRKKQLLTTKCKLFVILFTPVDSGRVKILLLNHKSYFSLHQVAAWAATQDGGGRWEFKAQYRTFTLFPIFNKGHNLSPMLVMLFDLPKNKA